MVKKDFSLTKLQKKYLTDSMNKVSRSFALVTPCFEFPLNHFMSASYLICRVVDNIEDCTQPLEWKSLRFAEFKELLSEPSKEKEILSTWEKEDWPGLNHDERRMMSLEGGSPLWQIYSQIPQIPRAVIGRWSSEMARGMECTEDPDSEPLFVIQGEVRLLERVQDYNQYCYFVAGTVGHMITDLVIDHYCLDDDTANILQDLCEACGRGLQKTNIVKDFASDLSRGVCYLPDEWMQDALYSPLTLSGAPLSWKQNISNDVMDELRDFFSYILSLPYQAKGYRLASLLCILPACQTMLKAACNHDKLFTAEHDIKISRMTFYRCIHDAKSMATSNEAILKYRENIEEQFAKMFPGSRTNCSGIIAEFG
jgi:farnesyl-diphosphate farnesyltransferase